MTRVGITGHRYLGPEIAGAIAELLRARISLYSPGELIGVSCLAESADMIFADAVAAHGGALEVILVAPEFYDGFTTATWERFKSLRDVATKVHLIPPGGTRRNAWHAAADKLLDSIDVMMAVWDGRPPAGNAGTADLVAAAMKRRIPVEVIWPMSPPVTPAPS